MKRKQLKVHICNLLRNNPTESAKIELSRFEHSSLITPLISLLCHTEPVVRWRAIFLLGLVVAEISAADLENARVIMRRFLWMLNDESGGIGWGVPEAMAEAMRQSSQLAAEYLHLLVSYTKDDGPEPFQDGNFLELPMIQRGVLWGICRLATRYQEALVENGVSQNLLVYLRSADSQVRAQACQLCGLLALDQFAPEIESLRDDTSQVALYSEDGAGEYTVGELAVQALGRIKRSRSL